MANTPKVLIINAVTGKEEIREMNAEELAQWKIDQEAFAAEQAAKAEKEAAKQAILDKLGITQDEAKLILQ